VDATLRARVPKPSDEAVRNFNNKSAMPFCDVEVCSLSDSESEEEDSLVSDIGLFCDDKRRERRCGGLVVRLAATEMYVSHGRDATLDLIVGAVQEKASSRLLLSSSLFSVLLRNLSKCYIFLRYHDEVLLVVILFPRHTGMNNVVLGIRKKTS
jgi:hypothetical protein